MKHEQQNPFEQNASNEVRPAVRQEQIMRLLRDIGFIDQGNEISEEDMTDDKS